MGLLAGVASRSLSRALVALGLVLCSLPVLAQPAVPPPPANFFTDTTRTVPADAAARIEQRLREFEKASSNQVLVVVADRVPQGFASLEEYTNRTAEAWRVGDKSRDNGAVLFVFLGDRKVRIEVGYGLEGALPDALASRIINDTITPRFRAGMYGEGILAGLEAIMGATRGEYKMVPWNQPAPSSRRALWDFPLEVILGNVLVVTVFLFFILLTFIVFRALFFSSATDPLFKALDALHRALDPRTYLGPGSAGRETSKSWGSSGGGWSGGGSSRSSGRSGGGGFSGRGGSFGGGGASGSW